jgi:hypothetical protein
MKKTVYLLLGLALGFLFGEILRRSKMERLATLEAKVAREKALNAEYEQDWQQELTATPFEERMESELWEAGMRLNNWIPPEGWDMNEDDDDEETE